MAPFMAELARSAGATNAVYGTVRPSPSGIAPTSAPIPSPIESR